MRKTIVSLLSSLSQWHPGPNYTTQTHWHCFDIFFSSTHISHSKMVKWVIGWRTCCTGVIFPTQQGTLSVHSIATPTLMAVKSPLSSALPAKYNNLHLSQKEKNDGSFHDFFTRNNSFQGFFNSHISNTPVAFHSWYSLIFKQCCNDSQPLIPAFLYHTHQHMHSVSMPNHSLFHQFSQTTQPKFMTPICNGFMGPLSKLCWEALKNIQVPKNMIKNLRLLIHYN